MSSRSADFTPGGLRRGPDIHRPQRYPNLGWKGVATSLGIIGAVGYSMYNPNIQPPPRPAEPSPTLAPATKGLDFSQSNFTVLIDACRRLAERVGDSQNGPDTSYTPTLRDGTTPEAFAASCIQTASYVVTYKEYARLDVTSSTARDALTGFASSVTRQLGSLTTQGDSDEGALAILLAESIANGSR